MAYLLGYSLSRIVVYLVIVGWGVNRLLVGFFRTYLRRHCVHGVDRTSPGTCCVSPEWLRYMVCRGGGIMERNWAWTLIHGFLFSRLPRTVCRTTITTLRPPSLSFWMDMYLPIYLSIYA